MISANTAKISPMAPPKETELNRCTQYISANEKTEDVVREIKKYLRRVLMPGFCPGGGAGAKFGVNVSKTLFILSIIPTT
jgi:hypothetical protein